MTLHWTRDAHVYQHRAADHLGENPAAALWLSPGYGKTAIVLHAFRRLVEAGAARHMLVVAPLRVVQTVWAQEIENWASLHGLTACRLHGTKKDQWLKRRDANVWLINYEGLPWLANMAKAGKIGHPFDVVVFDEIRRMKDPTGMRFRSVRPIAKLAKFRWGLTGTPASNGLMDLFGQFLILDNGAALGDRITKFRHTYFEQGYDGFSWQPRPGAQEAIEAKIKPYIFRADGQLDLPEFIYDNRSVELDEKARKVYNTMKNDLIASLEGKSITAANAAVLMGKLKQMANGRVYGENREVHEIHRAKADALMELIEELGDEQLLIAYEYQHDLAQLREVLGDGLPYIGSGVSEKQMRQTVDDWNERRIQILAAHPASAGHGLNLQKGAAHHILWWGPTFDLDHYIQFNDRLRRQGNQADAVVVHTFVTTKTVDETAIRARIDKASLQDALLSALTAEIGPISVNDTETGDPMDQQLQFRSDAQQQPAQQNPFAGGQQPQQGQNPFAGGQQPQQGFGGQQGGFGQPNTGGQPQQQNPFAGQQPNGGQVGGNPFSGAQQPQQGFGGQQAQAIREDVAAQPVQQPQPGQNPFGGQQPQQDTGWQQPRQVQDAQVVSETPPAEKPKRTRAKKTNAESATTTDWEQVVQLNLSVPASRYADVLAAIADALS